MSRDEAAGERLPFERSLHVESTLRLLESARAGDHEALECLFARHQIRPPCACPTPSSGYAAIRDENYNRGHAL